MELDAANIVLLLIIFFETFLAYYIFCKIRSSNRKIILEKNYLEKKLAENETSIKITPDSNFQMSAQKHILSYDRPDVWLNA